MASVSRDAPSLFLRNATGLVKGWSGFDAFTYSFMSVNLVTLGMFYSLAIFAFVPDGSAVASIVISGVAVTFLAIAYAGLIAVMPRAGGDYIWQSRVLAGIPGIASGAVVGAVGGLVVGGATLGGDSGNVVGLVVGVVIGAAVGYLRGGIAFVLAATGWWFILAQWAPIYGSIAKIEFFQPLAALVGWTDGVTFFTSQNGTFAVSLFVFVLLLVSSQTSFQTAFDKAANDLFGVSNAYQGTIDNAAATDGYTGGSLDAFGFGGGTWLLIPFMMFWILYPNWGSTLYGEVRGAGDFRRVLNGMLGGIWVTIVLALVFIFLADKTFGWTFFNSTNVSYIDYAYGYTTTAPVIPIWGYPPLLASFLVDSRIFQIAMVVVFGAWFLGWSGTLFLSSTRMIFAAAFDRVLPEAAARVSERRAVPWVALLFIMVPSVVVSAIYAYWTPFVSWTLDASLVIAVTFFGTAIAATILPWYKRDLYQASPIARYQIAGVPLISIGGAVTVVVPGWPI